MPKYVYNARKRTGEIANGEIEAGNETEVRIKLRAMGLEASRVVSRTPQGVVRRPAKTSFFKKKVEGRELQIFTRQFATLINAGIPVIDSIKMLGDGLRPGPLKEAVVKVRASIESGRRLGEALSQHPYAFDRLYCNMVQAGEEAGIMDTILVRLAGYIEKAEKIRGQVKGALLYPAVIVCVAIVVIAGILVFVMPKFEQIFSGSGQEPPALTKAVLDLSHSMVDQWYMYVGVLIGAPILISRWAGTPAGKDTLDRFLLKVPGIGDVLLKSGIAKMTRTLSTLLSSGVGVIDAIEIASRTAGNNVLEAALLRSKTAVMQGRPFAGPLSKEKVIPDMVVQMIAAGEQSGTMDIMLGKIADFYEEEVEVAVKSMMSLIEPVLMVVLGGIIAVLVIAMYLPVFKMGDVVQE